jgi:hypothetical protein
VLIFLAFHVREWLVRAIKQWRDPRRNMSDMGSSECCCNAKLEAVKRYP